MQRGGVSLKYSFISEKAGREVNEDRVGVKSADGRVCLVVCDGLGGHGMGDRASEIVVRSFCDISEDNIPVNEFHRMAFALAAENMFKAAAEDSSLAGMKTTAVAFYAAGKECCWSHIGDSRLYAFRNNEIAAVTKDHSVPQMLVDSGAITPDEIRSHPDRNKILRAVGTNGIMPDFEVSFTADMSNYDAFLLCTDGFWSHIDEKKMCRLLKNSSDADSWLRHMAKIVKRNGEGKKADNYSAIAFINKGKGVN